MEHVEQVAPPHVEVTVSVLLNVAIFDSDMLSIVLTRYVCSL